LAGSSWILIYINKSLLVTCLFDHPRKTIATQMRSTELKLGRVRKKLCQWHLRQYARARFSTVLRNMCTCTPMGCTHFLTLLVWWYR